MSSQLTITIPKIDGISPEGLKRNIDYLILEWQKELVSSLKTRVIVSDKEPVKMLRSKQYKIVSQTIEKPQSDPRKDPQISKIYSQVCVNYPAQAVAEVTLEGINLPEDINCLITAIKEEIEQYCKLFDVDISPNYQSKSKVEQISSESAGLELAIEVPKMPAVYLQKSKMDIECVVMRANLSSFGTGNDSVPVIKHKVSIMDHPKEPNSYLFKVSLLGEIEKRYFEIMWDIRRALRKIFRSDSAQSLSDSTVQGVVVCLPMDQNLYKCANEKYCDLKKTILEDLKAEHVQDFALRLQSTNAVSHPEQVCAKVFTSIDNSCSVNLLCQGIESALKTFFLRCFPDSKSQPQFCCVPRFQFEFKQDITEGHIQYTMNWRQERFMMAVSYPEALSAHFQDLKTCSEKFQDGVLHILSKLDLSVLQAQLEDPNSCYSKNCICGESVDRLMVRTSGMNPTSEVDQNCEMNQTSEMSLTSEVNKYKTVQVSIDSTKSKQEVAQRLLLEISKQIYE